MQLYALPYGLLLEAHAALEVILSRPVPLRRFEAGANDTDVGPG